MAKKRGLACDKKGTLHKATLELYTNRPRTTTLQTIAKKTRLPIRWLSSFPQAKAPSVNRVQILYEYLVEERLLV